MVEDAAFSPDGRSLATAAATVEVWHVEEKKRVLNLGGGGMTSVAFSPYGRRLIAGGFDGTARVWEVGTGKELAVLRPPG